MINIMQWMRTSFSSKLLHRHIFANEGGDSRDILDRLLGTNAGTFPLPWFQIDEEVMEKYGPALVCRFRVVKGFKEGDKICYGDSDLPSSECDSAFRHAMVLLGVAVVEGERFFLLQNWWKKKQFLECSEKYLCGCGAEAVFVKDATKISDSLPMVDGIYAEAADIDHQEAYDPESA